METKRLTPEVLKKVSEWLNEKGKYELNQMVNNESDTDNYIKTMSNVDSEKLKVPYDI
jgi:uncharacterized protein (UPF0297 family)